MTLKIEKRCVGNKRIKEISVMKNQRYQLKQNKYLSQDEQTLVYARLSELNKTSPRDALLIELALKTGARASELVGKGHLATGITPESLGEEDGIKFVFIEGLKGSDSRRLPIQPDLWDRLATLACDVRPGHRLFSITLRRFQQIWATIRPNKKKLHACRHTFGLEAYRKTRDVHLVKRALGHRNINNTMLYLDYAHSLEELKKLL